MAKPLIENVSDTALWVATYRAVESSRPDALFRDPLAARLAGEKGKVIANRVDRSRFVAWQVVIRTAIIDRFILEHVKNGVDMVVNLGAGLDTRPYRLDLPPSLKWVEVDFPRIIDLKEKELASDKPKCNLERIRVDLSDPEASKKCFAELATRAKNILLITEGVVPYLTNAQVAELASNLYAHPSFRYWICEYMSSFVVNYLQKNRNKHMGNAPFQFVPLDWNDFFKEKGWQIKETNYIPAEALKWKRPIPLPWWTKILLRWFAPKKRKEAFLKSTGYHVFEKIPMKFAL